MKPLLNGQASFPDLWERLPGITLVEFTARSARGTGWNGRGSGNVAVITRNASVVEFHESGMWNADAGKEFKFSNVFRWSLLESGEIRLDHLRFGESSAVHIFDIALQASGRWESVSPHVCAEDCYRGAVERRHDSLLVEWTIDGPQKQETINYTYR